MLKYKALCKKMMDDLKDSGMWIDWARQLHEESPETSKFLMKAAQERLQESYPMTKELFEEICKTDKTHDGKCMNEMINEWFEGWHEELEQKLKKTHSEKEKPR